MYQISDSELIIMRIIWKNEGSALYSQVTDALENMDFHWKKNTVLTFLSRLVEKKLLTTKKIGRRNDYIALVSEDEYHSQQTQDFIGKVYEGDVSGLISTLVNQHMIPDSEINALREFWNEKGQEDE